MVMSFVYKLFDQKSGNDRNIACILPNIWGPGRAFEAEFQTIMPKARFTLANLLHIFFDSDSANTQNINVTALKECSDQYSVLI